MTNNRVATCFVFLAAGLLLATPVFSSNMGFKKVFNLVPAGANNQPISLPYFYTPADVNSNSQVDSYDLCQDLNGGPTVTTVQAIKRYNVTTDTFSTDNCTTAGGSFTLTEGAGYFITNVAATAVVATVVGSHDDSFSVSFPPAGANNNLWSMPYHIMLTDVNSNSQLDSYDLCQSVNGGPAVVTMQGVKRYNAATDTFSTDNCTTAGGSFTLTIGTGYFLTNAAGQTITYLAPHF